MLLWGVLVIAPHKIQARLLDELHCDHPGISLMKAVARNYFWWPGVEMRLRTQLKVAQLIRQ